MHFDTDGIYTLLYTAEDECGNTPTEEREVLVASPRTVLYTDGTFIINEQPRDQAGNIALHGVATNVYIPFDPNGDTREERYEFSTATSRPWNSEVRLIKFVEFGEDIQPTDMSYWFVNCAFTESISFTHLDTSLVTKMDCTFMGMTYLASLDLSGFDTS